jgi:hypothetical protein
MNDDFVRRVMPQIERVALAAKRRASRVITDAHQLFMVYVHKRDGLLRDAIRADVTDESRADFEDRLQLLAGESAETVWVDDEEDSKNI